MAIGGSIESIALDGREFPVAADAAANRKLGGFENEYMSNGDGSPRLTKTRVGHQLDGLTLAVDDDRGDHEFLQDLQDLKRFFPIVVTFASGVAYQGQSQITGETQWNSQNSTAEITLQGPGRLTPQ